MSRRWIHRWISFPARILAIYVCYPVRGQRVPNQTFNRPRRYSEQHGQASAAQAATTSTGHVSTSDEISDFNSIGSMQPQYNDGSVVKQNPHQSTPSSLIQPITHVITHCTIQRRRHYARRASNTVCPPPRRLVSKRQTPTRCDPIRLRRMGTGTQRQRRSYMWLHLLDPHRVQDGWASSRSSPRSQSTEVIKLTYIQVSVTHSLKTYTLKSFTRLTPAITLVTTVTRL